jgi:16S rRNA pseudouridine516 synthase
VLAPSKLDRRRDTLGDMSASASEKVKAKRVRLDAFLARAGWGTRKTVRGLIRSGRVQIDGEPCRKAGEWVDGREVMVDDEIIEPPPAVLHLAMHKPVGFSCSHDLREEPLLFELVPEEWQGLELQAAGRLDRETSGLIVLTTDGGWIHRLTHPARKVTKRYRIEYEGQLAPDAVARCEAGLVLDDDEKPTRPAKLELEGSGRATLHLREGRRHQVRRMIAALGGEVLALHRDRIGRYELPPDLEPGDFVRLDDADLERFVTERGVTDSSL